MALPTKLTAAIAICAFVACSPTAIRAQTPWNDGFEGGQPSWHDAGGEGQHHIIHHDRVQGIAHTGSGSEWLQLAAAPGSRTEFSQGIGQPRIIEELAAGVWIKSDREAVQIALRIVLPRTTDPRTGRPLATTIIGDGYTEVGRWQLLRIEAIARLLAREVRILRAEIGPQVDEREAYVDSLVLIVYGGAGLTNIWIDDLDVAGYVAMDRRATGTFPPRAISPDRVRGTAAFSGPDGITTSWGSKGVTPLPPVGARPAIAGPRHIVKLVGSVLLVDDHPMLPRIIQHRGEPLAALKKIGFNTVWLQRLPASELLEEANSLGLWLICPPPRSAAMDGPALAEIGADFDCVLAWDLGDDLGDADLEFTERWADKVRAADRRGGRPLVCRPRSNLRGYSRPANLVLIDRRPLGTSLELPDYAAWVRRQPLLASPGTPVWTTVQTQPNQALRQQLAVLEPGYTPPLAVSPDQIRLLVYTAIASGSRGLVFTSDSPLDATDSDTRQRAATLELLNLELELMGPWAAAGSIAGTVEANVPEVTGTVLRTEHARLLLPIWSSPGAQCVPPQSAANALGVIVPGTPEATSAYELTPTGLQPLRHKRVAGGMCVAFDEFGLTSLALLAHDPLVVGQVHRRAAQLGRRVVELHRTLAAQRLAAVQALAGPVASRSSVPQAGVWLDAARKSLQSSDVQFTSGDMAGAALSAQRAMRSLRLLERGCWDAACKGLSSPVMSPAAASFETLPCHWRLVDRLAGCRFSGNLIGGGDFEDVDTTMRAGWRYIMHQDPALQAAVDLVPQAAHSGRFGARLTVVASDTAHPPAAVDLPPILFTSPSMQVEAGQIVCIHGWVNVPRPITASSDGLLVVDSISGEALADRIGPTKGWHRFALYRAVPRSGPLCVTMAMSGLGEAWLDDIAIEIVQTPSNATRR